MSDFRELCLHKTKRIQALMSIHGAGAQSWFLFSVTVESCFNAGVKLASV